MPEIRRVGYFGSYARGDWGVGSDLDLLIVVEQTELPLELRSTRFDTTPLPVPADLLVYTAEEWNRPDPEHLFMKTLRRGVIWAADRED